MTGKTGIAYSDSYLNYDFGPQHPLRPIRVKRTVELIRSICKSAGLPPVEIEPRTATVEELELFHDPNYVRQIQEASEHGRGLLDSGDTPAFKSCFEASSIIAGGSIQLAKSIIGGLLAHGFNPGGGLHHAHRNSASGFCIFNDAALSVAFLKEKGFDRIAYLDIDAHHGDGVMYGFYDDGSLLDIDFHESGRYLFPGTGFTDEAGKGKGAGLKINIPLLPGTGDSEYLRVFDRIVPATVRKYGPEFILVQAGADSHRGDPLAHLDLTTHTYFKVVSDMHKLAHEFCEGRMILFGGGGYNVANVTRSWTVAYLGMAGVEVPAHLPADWAESPNNDSRQTFPSTLHDPSPTSSQDGRIIEYTEGILRDLESCIPLLRD